MIAGALIKRIRQTYGRYARQVYATSPFPMHGHGLPWRIPSLQLLLFLAMAGLASDLPATITNGGFEQGLDGWRAFWSREKNAGGAYSDTTIFHSGKAAARIEHSGGQDWSFEPNARLDVQPGDLFEFDGWFKLAGSGSVTLCVSTWDKDGQVIDWSHGSKTLREGGEWQHGRARFVIPASVAQIQPRLIGYGPGTNWVDDLALVKKDNVMAARRSDLPPALSLENSKLSVKVDTREGTLAVFDKRTGRTWKQQALSPDIQVQDARAEAGGIRLNLFHVPLGIDLVARLKIDAELPEVTCELSGQGELPEALKYPHPFVTLPGDDLIIPMNEGISYPVDDKSIDPFRLVAYGGHGICMAFWGVVNGAAGQMAIIESPDDAAIKLSRIDGRLVVAPEWDPQKRQIGSARRLRYVFCDQGGYVAMAKRYRAYARKIGLFKTLAEKRQANPNIDLLVGAVNVWCWDGNAVSLVKELQAAGINRILWSNAQSPENLRALNDLGVLTSRYDIYQDVMDPANFPRLRGLHADWTTAAWPKDIITGADGHWIKGWGVETKDGGMVSCGVICDQRAPDYARERIPADLATHPYRCRFIDTTTAAPWNECYDTRHPMTRTDSKKYKMDLLKYVSQDCRQVTGCETGHDAAVPFVDYFEGMMSLGPYRVPDSGRRMSQIWTNVPEPVAKFQLGHRYRLPLWELVYHDCVVAQWYWGDYNNKLPSLWDKRDLFNVLYGVPPMFMFDRKLWEAEKARFIQSYTNTCPHACQVGYQEMTSHRYLTPDRAVQQTVFANGVTITVNFGALPYSLNDRISIPPLGYNVTRP